MRFDLKSRSISHKDAIDPHSDLCQTILSNIFFRLNLLGRFLVLHGISLTKICDKLTTSLVVINFQIHNRIFLATIQTRLWFRITSRKNIPNGFDEQLLFVCWLVLIVKNERDGESVVLGISLNSERKTSL